MNENQIRANIINYLHQQMKIRPEDKSIPAFNGLSQSASQRSVKITDMKKIRIIRGQSQRAAQRAVISLDDEKRIYRNAIQELQSKASMAGIISRIYTNAAQCAKSRGSAA